MIGDMQRAIGVGVLLLLAACGAKTGISPGGAIDAGADSAVATDAGADSAVATDAGTDSAVATCSLPLRHEGISGGSTVLSVGTACDQLAVCAESHSAQSTIHAASSRMTCADATLPECEGPGCYYRLGATRLVTMQDLALFCSVADSISELVCTVWGP